MQARHQKQRHMGTAKSLMPCVQQAAKCKQHVQWLRWQSCRRTHGPDVCNRNVKAPMDKQSMIVQLQICNQEIQALICKLFVRGEHAARCQMCNCKARCPVCYLAQQPTMLQAECPRCNGRPGCPRCHVKAEKPRGKCASTVSEDKCAV